MSMIPRMPSTNLPIIFAYQGTPAAVDIGHQSFIPSQSIPVTGPVYIQQFPFSNNNNNNLSPFNRDSKFGSAPYSSPYTTASSSASTTQLPPLSSLVKQVNQSSLNHNNNNHNSTLHAPSPASSTIHKQAPVRIGVPVSMANYPIQPVLQQQQQQQQQQQPQYGQISQRPQTSMYSGYLTPPSPVASSPQSFIQPTNSILQQTAQHVPAYRAPHESFSDNSYVPLVPSRSLSTPIHPSKSSSQDTNLTTAVDNTSARSNSNPLIVEKSISKPSPTTIINKSNGKRMIQRKLSIDIRKTKQCPVCGKKCSRPSTLKTHYFIHTGDNPYKCTWPDCTKAFNVKSNMIRHMKSHAKKLAKHNIH